jgi:hypothetical protein
LTICALSSAIFPGAVIANVNISSSVVEALLCVTDSSSLVFDSARFHGNKRLPLFGDPTPVHVHIKNSQFTNNAVMEGLEGAALHLRGGTGLVQSSIFAGNRALGLGGGAIGLGNRARLTVASSVLQDNNGEHMLEQQLVQGNNWKGIHHSLCDNVVRAILCDKQLMQQL